MESTRNKNTELGRPELPAGSVAVSESFSPECLVTTSGVGASKSPKSSCLGKRKSKWSHNENKILRECYIRSISNRLQQVWVEKGMREFSSQRLAVEVRNIKSKNILSKVERKEAYVSDELLNETP